MPEDSHHEPDRPSESAAPMNESAEDAPHRMITPGAVMRIAVAIGLVCGLMEVAWAYLRYNLRANWQTVLPDDGAGFLAFLGTALLADGFAIALLGLLPALLVTLSKSIRRRPHAGWLITAGLIFASLAALVRGTLEMLARDPAETGTPFQKGLMLAATAGVAFATTAVLALLRRRVHPRAPWVAWAALCAVLLVAAFGGFRRHQAHAPAIVYAYRAESAPRATPHILLVTIDTLRADALGLAGHPFVETPAIDALARDAVVFDTAIAQAPTTTPSHCTIMTSLYPDQHAALNGIPMQRGLITLAEILRAHGYNTAAFTSAGTTRSFNTGLDHGFDLYQDSLVPWSTLFARDELQQLIAPHALSLLQHSYLRAEHVASRCLAWLTRRPEQPFFCWLHFFDPHDPYGAPPPFHGRYADKARDGRPMPEERERYAEEIAYVDAQLARVFDALRAEGRYDETLIIVTADHGEAFGEKHGRYTEVKHGLHLYDTTQRVPLIVKPPGGATGTRPVRQQVQLIDLAPTVLALLGLDPPPTFEGRSLLHALRDRNALKPQPAYATCVAKASDPDQPQLGEIWARRVAVRTPAWKYIATPYFNEEMLFRLEKDPNERHEVSRRNASTLDRFAAVARERFGEQDQPLLDPTRQIAPALQRQLEALGYLGNTEIQHHDAASNGVTAEPNSKP